MIDSKVHNVVTASNPKCTFLNEIKDIFGNFKESSSFKHNSYLPFGYFDDNSKPSYYRFTKYESRLLEA